jgi:glucose/mannose transport system substrate-binding protein
MNVVATAAFGLTTLALLSGTAIAAPKTNLLSQWASGSDAAAIAKLGDMFTKAGGQWQTTSIAGHTANALAKLRADVIAGDPPPAVQLKGPEIKEWYETGGMDNLDDLATKEGWDKLVAPVLLPIMKPEGHWVAVPMNIHRINWFWGSVKGMAKAGITSYPKTWKEFNADCDKAVAAGIVCLAHASFYWTDGIVFEDMVYGTNPELFQKAFVEGNTDAMRSQGMIDAFTEMRTIQSKYMDPGIAGRDTDTAGAMMATGKAAFQIMGDWNIGYLTAAGYHYGTDYTCGPTPSDNGKPGFILNSDSVAFFKQSDPDFEAGSQLLAHLIMSTDFQYIFNQAKGSIPARLDVDISKGFNPCQVESQKDLRASIDAGTLVNSMSQNMTLLQKYVGPIEDVITKFVNTPDMQPKDAAEQMAEGVEAQQ